MGRNACSFLLHQSHFIIYKTLPLCHKSRKEAKEDFCTTHHKLPGLKSMLIPMNNVWILQRFESKRILAKSLYFFFLTKNDFSLWLTFVWSIQFIIWSNTLLMLGWQGTRKEHQCCMYPTSIESRYYYTLLYVSNSISWLGLYLALITFSNPLEPKN